MREIRLILEELRCLLESPPSGINFWVATDRYERALRSDMKQSRVPAETIEASIREFVERTKQNLGHELIAATRRALAAIGSEWNGSSFVFEAVPAEDSMGVLWEPTHDATVHLVKSHDDYKDSDTPSFTAWFHKAVKLDDVLSPGDTDFFRDPAVETDYFAIVNELKSPGIRKQARPLTLYTARPVKDRGIYERAETTKTVPSGIYFTKNRAEALAIAADLPGPDKARDVYRVRVEPRYVIEMPSTPGHFAATATKSSTIPILGIEMIDRAEAESAAKPLE